MRLVFAQLKEASKKISKEQIIFFFLIIFSYLYLFYTPDERYLYRRRIENFIRSFTFNTISTYKPGGTAFGEHYWGPLCRKDKILLGIIRWTDYQPGYDASSCP